MPIDVLVLDLDDTLYLERDFVFSGFAAVDRYVLRTMARDGFLSIARSKFDNGERGRIFDDTLAELEVEARPDLVSALVNVYQTHLPDIHLLPDARELLEIAASVTRLGLISDGYLEVQRRKVNALGLESQISEIILTDQWGRAGWKPSLRAFEEMMRRTPDVSPAAFVYVGDNPKKDFIAPRALGWQTIRVRRRYGEHYHVEPSADSAADREIENFECVIEYLYERRSGRQRARPHDT